MKIIDMEVTCPDCGNTWEEPLIVRYDEVQAERDALKTALQACRKAMARWGAEEDGIPEDAYPAYEEAGRLLGVKAVLEVTDASPH